MTTTGIGSGVSLDDLENAPKPEIPDDSGMAQEELNALAHRHRHEQKTFQDELGWFGKIVGGRSEKPGNISAMVLVACLILMPVFYWTSSLDGEGSVFERIFGGLLSIVTLVLGYLFGSNDRS